MVKLEEVPDEELNAPQPYEKTEEDDWDTDSESSVTSDLLDLPEEETLTERLYALADIIPPSTRASIQNLASTVYGYGAKTAAFSGKSAWVICTSALLLGVPWALAFSEEQQVQEMEREMRMQQSAGELLTQGGSQGATPAAAL